MQKHLFFCYIRFVELTYGLEEIAWKCTGNLKSRYNMVFYDIYHLESYFMS